MKVGDRVKVHDLHSGPSHYCGRLGVVVEIKDGSTRYPIRVLFDDSHEDYMFAESELLEASK